MYINLANKIRTELYFLVELLYDELNPVENPRRFSVLVGVAIFTLLLAMSGFGWIDVFLLPFIWVLGILVIGRWSLIIWLFFGKVDSPPVWIDKWPRLFWGGMFFIIFYSILFSAKNEIVTLLSLFFPACMMLYAINKLGCWKYKCCNWINPRQNKSKNFVLDLPLLEAVIAFIIFTILILLLLNKANPYTTVCFSFIIFSFLRGFSMYARTTGLKQFLIKSKFDAIQLFLFGLYFLHQ